MKKNYISYQEVNILKGLALIFMYIHHLFTYQNWYVSGINYPNLEKIANIFRDPFNSVSIFCFITGYTYFFAKNKSYKYSIIKILKFLINFIIVLAIFVTIGILTKTYNFNLEKIILELFGIKREVMTFCWYIYFYIIVILLLPIIDRMASKLENNNLTKNIILFIIIPTTFLTALKGFFGNNLYTNDMLFNIIRFYPAVIIGYLCSKYEYFYKLDALFKRKNKIIKLLICTGIFIISFMLKYYIPLINIGTILSNDVYYEININLDCFYTVFLIFSFLNIIRVIKKTFILENIGKLSLLMWFSHCIFFGCSKEIFMPILYYPKNAFLVLIWALLLNYIIAFILNKLINPIINKIK